MKRGVCQVCFVQTIDHFALAYNSLIKCRGCCVLAHRYCYQPHAERGEFMCDQCDAKESGARCVICSNGGLLKKIKKIKGNESKYGHPLCLLYGNVQMDYTVESYCSLNFIETRDGSKVRQTRKPEMEVESETKQPELTCRECNLEMHIHACLGMNQEKVACSLSCHIYCALKAGNASESVGWKLIRNKLDVDTQELLEYYLNPTIRKNYRGTSILEVWKQKWRKRRVRIQIGNPVYLLCQEHAPLDIDCRCGLISEHKIEWVFCEQCNIWQHLDCLPLSSEEKKVVSSIGEPFICDRCHMWSKYIQTKEPTNLLKNQVKLHLSEKIYLMTQFEKKQFQFSSEMEEQLFWKISLLPCHKYIEGVYKTKIFERSLLNKIHYEKIKWGIQQKQFQPKGVLLENIKIINFLVEEQILREPMESFTKSYCVELLSKFAAKYHSKNKKIKLNSEKIFQNIHTEKKQLKSIFVELSSSIKRADTDQKLLKNLIDVKKHLSQVDVALESQLPSKHHVSFYRGLKAVPSAQIMDYANIFALIVYLLKHLNSRHEEHFSRRASKLRRIYDECKLEGLFEEDIHKLEILSIIPSRLHTELNHFVKIPKFISKREANRETLNLMIASALKENNPLYLSGLYNLSHILKLLKSIHLSKQDLITVKAEKEKLLQIIQANPAIKQEQSIENHIFKVQNQLLNDYLHLSGVLLKISELKRNGAPLKAAAEKIQFENEQSRYNFFMKILFNLRHVSIRHFHHDIQALLQCILESIISQISRRAKQDIFKSESEYLTIKAALEDFPEVECSRCVAVVIENQEKIHADIHLMRVCFDAPESLPYFEQRLQHALKSYENHGIQFRSSKLKCLIEQIHVYFSVLRKIPHPLPQNYSKIEPIEIEQIWARLCALKFPDCELKHRVGETYERVKSIFIGFSKISNLCDWSGQGELRDYSKLTKVPLKEIESLQILLRSERVVNMECQELEVNSILEDYEKEAARVQILLRKLAKNNNLKHAYELQKTLKNITQYPIRYEKFPSALATLETHLRDDFQEDHEPRQKIVDSRLRSSEELSLEVKVRNIQLAPAKTVTVSYLRDLMAQISGKKHISNSVRKSLLGTLQDMTGVANRIMDQFGDLLEKYRRKSGCVTREEWAQMERLTTIYETSNIIDEELEGMKVDVQNVRKCLNFQRFDPEYARKLLSNLMKDRLHFWKSIFEHSSNS